VLLSSLLSYLKLCQNAPKHLILTQKIEKKLGEGHPCSHIHLPSPLVHPDSGKATELKDGHWVKGPKLILLESWGPNGFCCHWSAGCAVQSEVGLRLTCHRVHDSK